MNLRTRTWILVVGGAALALGACGGVNETGLGTAEICTNGIDDDGDGKKDCEDLDCAGHAACQPGIEAFCDNGVDDDGDGPVDCADPDCAGDQACVVGREVACADGQDNDDDGAADCLDSDCALDSACREICGDGEDNDLDGAVDCDDADCQGDPACQVVGQEWCSNGVDDDGDGDIDCEDADCDTALVCRLPPERCDNGEDDDLDGDTDCADTDCDYSPYCVEYDCLNGRDDDGDGLVDCQDEDCAGLPECWTSQTCEPAEWIGCDSTVLTTTEGRLNNFPTYPCAEGSSLGGPERYYAFTAMEPTVIVVGLETLGAELTLLALGNDDTLGCTSAHRCLVATSSGGSGQRLELVLQAGETVYLVVDGAGNAGGEFGIGVQCEPAPVEVCNNGSDDDDDGDVDCWDWDCLGVPNCAGWTGAGTICQSFEDCAPGEDCLFTLVPNITQDEGICTKACAAEGQVPACAESVPGVGLCKVNPQTTHKNCVLACGSAYGNVACPPDWHCVEGSNGSVTNIVNGVCLPN